MGEYIGDKSRSRKGQSANKSGVSGDTKQYDIVKNNSKSSSNSGRSSAGGHSAKNTPQRSAAASSKNSVSHSGSRSSAPAKKSGSQAKKPSASRSTSSKSPSNSGSAKSNAKGSTKSNSSSRNNTSKKAYSEPLEAKKGSAYERELRSSDRARDIKNARRRRNYSKHRKLFNFMFYAAIFVAVTAVVIIMSVTVLFGIQEIEVITEPEVPYTEQQIISSCDVKCGQNLFLAPIEGASEQIMQKLPYIENCTVTRKLPSKIVIRATAAEPSCMVRDASGRMLVVSTGMRTLEYAVSSGDALEVPIIEGVLASASDVGDVVGSMDMNYFRVAVEMVRVFDENGLEFDKITFSKGGNITAVYDGRIKLNIGTSANLEDKLQLAAVLINEGKITKHERGNLDLSIDGRATFTPDYVENAILSSKNVAGAR